jgi:hypothetical protein
MRVSKTYLHVAHPVFVFDALALVFLGTINSFDKPVVRVIASLATSQRYKSTEIDTWTRLNILV